MYPRLLLETREEIAGDLAEIFNISLVIHEVPDDWRVANVVPLFKKGSRDRPGNYIDEGHAVDFVFMDVNQAFDKVPHGRLIQKMELCVQFWSSHYRKNVIGLERVQRRFTKMLPGTESLSYDKRQDRIGYLEGHQDPLAHSHLTSDSSNGMKFPASLRG
eukprot:g32165.t1